MKTISTWFLVAALGLPIFSSVSCMTSYDAYGRPMQTVDPGLAVAGIAAAGLIGYAAGDDRDRHYNRGHHGGYYGGYYGGYSRQRYHGR